MGFSTCHADRGSALNPGGISMKTGTVLRTALSLTLLALFASCSPTSSNNTDAANYQNPQSSDSGIIGGVAADLSYQQQNGIVGIYDADRGALCTGSLIAKNLVLTAAHCINTFNAKSMLVFFSPSIKTAIKVNPFTGQTTYSKTLVRQAVKAVRNAKYNPKSESMTESTNDIALIRLASDAPAGFQLAKLPSADLQLQAGEEVSLSGYGVDQYQTDPSTGEELSASGSGVLRKVDQIKIQSVLPSGEEVTFDQSQGRGACHGDSGGPAYLTDAKTQTTYLIGVTSRGSGDCNEIAVYSSTIGQAKWIADTSATLLQLPLR